jgi:hypothetical protein
MERSEIKRIVNEIQTQKAIMQASVRHFHSFRYEFAVTWMLTALVLCLDFL